MAVISTKVLLAAIVVAGCISSILCSSDSHGPKDTEKNQHVRQPKHRAVHGSSLHDQNQTEGDSHTQSTTLTTTSATTTRPTHPMPDNNNSSYHHKQPGAIMKSTKLHEMHHNPDHGKIYCNIFLCLTFPQLNFTLVLGMPTDQANRHKRLVHFDLGYGDFGYPFAGLYDFHDDYHHHHHGHHHHHHH